MKSLLYSRKFRIAVFGVIQAIVLELFPDIPDALWQSIAALAGVLIASIAIEDMGEKIGKGNGSSSGHG